MPSATDNAVPSDSHVPPMTPVNDNESAPTDAPANGGKTNPPSEKKLTIRVPVEYTPPTPPPSAELPAVPPRRASLTTPIPAMVKKRASAPVSSWSAAEALPTHRKISRTEELSSSEEPVMPAVPEAPETPTTPTPVPRGETTAQSKMILMAASHSVVHLPTAGTRAQSVVPEKQAKYGAELLPTPPPSHTASRPRRKSTPANKAEAPRRVRNSPSHVSLIDFDSSSDEREDEESAQSEPQTPSIPEESDVPTPTPRRPKLAPSNDSDLSRWAPDPIYVPQAISVSCAVNAQRQPWSTRSRSSTSMRSADREGSLVGSTRRPGTGSTRNTPLMSSVPMDAVQRDVDYTMRALMSPETLAAMLSDPLARQRFREFLSVDSSTAELDCYTDAQFLAHSIDQIRANGQAFRDLYMSSSSDAAVKLTSDARRELLGVLQQVLAVDSSLGSTQNHLLESLYNDQFQRFVKHKIIQEVHVTLGKANLTSQESEGLGDTFVLTNPRLPDHPIVLVSDGFVDVTGYPKAQIVGRNCRFLQGPGTPPESVQRIRDGLNSGKGCTELLLNYRRNGEPFYCLLCIIPVRNASGSIVYFIGGQTNVTGLLATDKRLDLQGTGAGQPFQMSPALAMLREQTSRSSLSVGAAGPNPRARGAAGAVASHPSTSSGGFFRGLFGRASAAAPGGSMRADGKQVIAGAEAMINAPGARGLQDQYALFQNTYNKILIFKFKKREITFVSPQMLTYLGLPTRTSRELHASPLIRNDIASLLTAGEDRNETRRLREELKDAIRRGSPCSLYCGVKIPTKGLLTRSDSTRHKFGMMHMTPIKDGDNVAVAFVAIFG